MTVQVLAFGIVKSIFNNVKLSIELPDESTADDLKTSLETRFPQLRELASCFIAVNDEYAAKGQALHPDDEIAVIPPVSGG